VSASCKLQFGFDELPPDDDPPADEPAPDEFPPVVVLLPPLPPIAPPEPVLVDPPLVPLLPAVLLLVPPLALPPLPELEVAPDPPEPSSSESLPQPADSSVSRASNARRVRVMVSP